MISDGDDSDVQRRVAAPNDFAKYKANATRGKRRVPLHIDGTAEYLSAEQPPTPKRLRKSASKQTKAMGTKAAPTFTSIAKKARLVQQQPKATAVIQAEKGGPVQKDFVVTVDDMFDV